MPPSDQARPAPGGAAPVVMEPRGHVVAPPDTRAAVLARCRLLVRDCAAILDQPLPETEVYATAERIAALVLTVRLRP